MDEVVSVTQTGIILRVLIPVQVADAGAWLQEHIGELLPRLQWQPGRTSIEDVFVVATGGKRAR